MENGRKGGGVTAKAAKAAGGRRRRRSSVRTRVGIRFGWFSVNLDPQLLSDFAFLHYNYKYDWLRLTLDEIITAYDWQATAQVQC